MTVIDNNSAPTPAPVVPENPRASVSDDVIERTLPERHINSHCGRQKAAHSYAREKRGQFLRRAAGRSPRFIVNWARAAGSDCGRGRNESASFKCATSFCARA